MLFRRVILPDSTASGDDGGHVYVAPRRMSVKPAISAMHQDCASAIACGKIFPMRKLLLIACLSLSCNVQAAPWEDPYLDHVKDLDSATLSAMHRDGDMPATVELSRRLFVAGVYPEAIRLTSLAAAQGIRAGHHYLGMMYRLCHASCRNLTRAIPELEKSAALGHPLSHEALADIYYGDFPGVPKDLARARRHYIAAAEQGVGSAQLTAADMLCRGIGGERNVAEGRKWVQRLNETMTHSMDNEDVGCD
jgi:TPR repeat protein